MAGEFLDVARARAAATICCATRVMNVRRPLCEFASS
jgi:hypothetical protein